MALITRKYIKSRVSKLNLQRYAAPGQLKSGNKERLIKVLYSCGNLGFIGLQLPGALFYRVLSAGFIDMFLFGFGSAINSGSTRSGRLFIGCRFLDFCQFYTDGLQCKVEILPLILLYVEFVFQTIITGMRTIIWQE